MMFDDPLVGAATFFPVAFVAVGLGFLWWAAHGRLPAELESDVLEALSAAEALPVAQICDRPPLAGQPLHPETVSYALEHLRRTGRAVRWYARPVDQEDVDTDEREALYRRVA
jgi:hypothetical protein